MGLPDLGELSSGLRHGPGCGGQPLFGASGTLPGAGTARI